MENLEGAAIVGWMDGFHPSLAGPAGLLPRLIYLLYVDPDSYQGDSTATLSLARSCGFAILRT